MPVATIDYVDGYFIIECQIFDLVRLRGFPSRIQMPGLEKWKIPPTEDNIRYIFDNYDEEEISLSAAHMMTLIKERSRKKHNFPTNFPFINKARPYQWDALNKAYGERDFALFMEMRTGKSFVDICLASAYYLNHEIDAWLIVLFPGAIKATWKIQLTEHCPVPYEALLLQSGQNHRTRLFINTPINKLKILIVGIESLSNGAGPGIITQFVDKHKTKFTIDESVCIKNPKAFTKAKKLTRTKLCWKLGAECVYRMILTGTPITQGIEDLYSQFRFLNWQILGYKSYFAFKAKHCVMGGFRKKNKKTGAYESTSIIGYNKVDSLLNKVSSCTYIISTEDAIGIPDEVFQPVYVEQSVTQTRLLKELGDPFNMSTVLDGDELEVETVLERMIRYQQIVGGHFPWRTGKDFSIKPLDKNPKLEALKGIIEIIPKNQKAIIWAKFVPELIAIADTLEVMNESYILYRGLSDKDREDAQRWFMTDDGPRFWVASQQESARGVELASASIHIFYSNSFSYDDRKQAMMRTNSSKQKSSSITYIDIVMNHKIDKQITDALIRKQSMADYVTSTLCQLQKNHI